MKILFILLSICISTSSAFAEAPLTCSTNVLNKKNGTFATFSNDRKHVDITKVSGRNEEVLARLVCKKVTPRHGGPLTDKKYAVRTCSEPNLRNEGYSLYLMAGGFHGGLSARLYKVLPDDMQEQVSTMICVEAQNGR